MKSNGRRTWSVGEVAERDVRDDITPVAAIQSHVADLMAAFDAPAAT